MLSAKTSRTESGFSLPELMVVISAAAILMAIAVPAVNTTLNQFDLVLSAQQIASEIQYARMKAVSTNEALRVRFTVGNRSYRVEFENGTVHAGPFTLPRRVVLNTVDGGDPVSFPGDEILFLPTGTLPINGTGSAGRVKLISQNGLRVDVVVDGGGMVRLTPTYRTPPAAF